MSKYNAVDRHSSTEDTNRLRESRTRLDLLNGVYTAITNGTDPADVLTEMVGALAAAFADCQVCYGELSATGRFHTSAASPNVDADFSFDLSECANALNTLASGSPLAISDADQGRETGPLEQTLAARNCRALLAVNVLHTRLRSSLLCMVATIPRVWTDHEITTLSEVAEALKVLLREARMLQERRLAERSLRRTNKRIVNILESVTDAFFEVDLESRITYTNPQGEALTGSRQSALLGQPFFSAFPGLKGASISGELHCALVRRSPCSIEEHDPVRGLWLQVKIYPFHNGAAIYVRDTTAQRKTLRELEECRERLTRSLDAAKKALFFSVEARDPYTAAHMQRVAALGCGMARVMGLSRDEVEDLRVTGLLHDVGKIAVPTEILNRPGSLTAAEMSIVRTHVQIGYNILRDIEFSAPVALVALQHHERLDGSGYPHGIKAVEILPESRIIMVADVVEAMSSHRPYRPALGTERALEEILAHRATRYDAACVDACVEVLRRYGFDLEQAIVVETGVREQ